MLCPMQSRDEKLARPLVWLMLLGGLALIVYGAYGLLTDGYNLRGLWITGSGLVFILASYAGLSERQRR
jgi:hypothetical protein